MKDQKEPSRTVDLSEKLNDDIEKMAKYYRPRDPARIDKILAVIGELWKLEPDTRLGQLLLNFAYLDGDVKDSTNQSMYNQEDTVTLELLEKKLAKEKAARASAKKSKKTEKERHTIMRSP